MHTRCFVHPTAGANSAHAGRVCAAAVPILHADGSERLVDHTRVPRKAHRALDDAVERAYGKRTENNSERVAHMFELYKELTK